MSKLTAAIKKNDVAAALELINGTSLASRFYKLSFNLRFGNLLEAQENINSKNTDDIRHADQTYEQYNKVENFGRNPMQLAAERGFLEIVKALLAAGVSPEAKWVSMSRFKSVVTVVPEILTSPLHLALANGHDAVASCLIDAGADVITHVPIDLICFDAPQTFDRWGWSWHRKVVSGSLSKHGLIASTVYIAAAKCNFDTIRKLVAYGAKITHGCIHNDYSYGTYTNFLRNNHSDYENASVLMHAVVNRKDEDVAIIEGLLHLGADPNKFTRRKIEVEERIISVNCHTALSLAVRDHKVNIAKVLIKHGATLWPTEFCSPTREFRGPDIEWFDVKPEIIAAAQQIAAEIGISLQPPLEYPDATGTIIRRPTITQQPIIIEQPMLNNFGNQEPLNNLGNQEPLNNIIPNQEIDGIFNQAYQLFSQYLGFSTRVQNILATVRTTIGNIENFVIDNRTEIGRKLTILKQLDPTFEEDSLLSSFKCPITNEVMRRPMRVIATDQTYEDIAIERWFANSNIDPKSGVRVNNKELKENLTIKQAIVETLDRLIAAATAIPVAIVDTEAEQDNIAPTLQMG